MSIISPTSTPASARSSASMILRALATPWKPGVHARLAANSADTANRGFDDRRGLRGEQPWANRRAIRITTTHLAIGVARHSIALFYFMLNNDMVGQPPRSAAGFSARPADKPLTNDRPSPWSRLLRPGLGADSVSRPPSWATRTQVRYQVTRRGFRATSPPTVRARLPHRAGSAPVRDPRHTTLAPCPRTGSRRGFYPIPWT